MLATGTFMKNCKHKTLPFSRLPDGTLESIKKILSSYPGTSEASETRLSNASLWKDGAKRFFGRSVVTFRQTANHLRNPRCPELPAHVGWPPIVILEPLLLTPEPSSAAIDVAPPETPMLRATPSSEDAAASSAAVDEADKALEKLEIAMSGVEEALKHCPDDKKKSVRNLKVCLVR